MIIFQLPIWQFANLLIMNFKKLNLIIFSSCQIANKLTIWLFANQIVYIGIG